MHSELRTRLKREAEDIHNAAARESRSLTVPESKTFDTLIARVTELDEQEARESAAAKHRVELGLVGGGRFTTNGPAVYLDPTKAGVDSPSFFRDMYSARKGDYAAAERLSRNQAARTSETRALTTGATTGGSFAPPGWILEDWVALARPGRIVADLCNKQPLPQGVSSLNLPKVSSGTVVGVQQTQNTQISNTDLQTTSVSSGITTIAGQQIVSLQLINQSGIPLDKIILGDLAFDYSQQLDLQVVTGTGANGQLRGLENGASVGTTAFTTTSPSFVSTTSANSFYNALIRAVNAIAVGRYLPAEQIVMTPTRWNWCQEALDTSTRPMILSGGSAFNAPGISTEITAEGASGTLLNLPVYVANSLPSNHGVGTNADEVIVLRGSDVFLYEGELALESFDATLANQASILLRALNFVGMIPDRYAASVNLVNGTGLVAPTL